MFRQSQPPDNPLQLRFKRLSDGTLAATDRRAWNRAGGPPPRHPAVWPIEAFNGTAPSATIDWKGRKAAVACAPNEIAWPCPPVRGHWMGIDAAGRDVLARVLYGMRIG